MTRSLPSHAAFHHTQPSMTPDRSIGPTQLALLLGSWRASRPVYRGLAETIRVLVLDGRLPLRTRLPAERELAEALGVSRTTVTSAYDLLRQTGFLASRRGSGSWTELPAARDFPVPGRPWAPLQPVEGTGIVDLAIAAPAAEPDFLARAAAEAAGALPALLGGHGYDPRGLASLRAALAARYTRRGVPTSPDEILVTNGAQHALGLVLTLLVRQGDRVLVESPTYPNALDAVRRAGARPVPFPVTGRAWDVEMVEATVRQSAPRLAYLIPDFHNPTGHLASDEERAVVVATARRAGTYVVADETLVDLALDPVAAVRPMAGYDADGFVITLGSTSKSYWGGLRIGWVRATAELVRELLDVRATSEMASPVLAQLVVERLLADGAAPLVARRESLAARRDALVRALARELPSWRFRVPNGGLSLWAELPEPVSTPLALGVERHGVRVVAGPRFGVDGTLERYLRLPFTLPATDLEGAVARLATAYGELGSGASRRSGVPAMAV